MTEEIKQALARLIGNAYETLTDAAFRASPEGREIELYVDSINQVLAVGASSAVNLEIVEKNGNKINYRI